MNDTQTNAHINIMVMIMYDLAYALWLDDFGFQNYSFRADWKQYIITNSKEGMTTSIIFENNNHNNKKCIPNRKQ